MLKKPIIQIMGPTGVGKSKISILISKELNCEIISADSMQVYQDFDIGTDKIKGPEQGGITHHMIDILDNCAQFNAYQFLTRSYQISKEIFKRGKIPLVSGGTALYISVMRQGIFEENKDQKITRIELIRMIEDKGLDFYWNKLNIIDPDYADKIGAKDKKRIIRAFEIYFNNDCIPSEMFEKKKNLFKNYQFIKIGLNIRRDLLYQKIEKRVDLMIKKGLVNEVKLLLNKYSRDCPPFTAIGYKEILSFIENKISLEEAVILLKKNSRNYAKRQLTWYRNEEDIQWFSPANTEKIINFLRDKL